MKTMSIYTELCSEENVKLAYDLGAPIYNRGNKNFTKKTYYEIDKGILISYNGKLLITPTTQEMINWLKEKGFRYRIDENVDNFYFCIYYNNKSDFILKCGNIKHENNIIIKVSLMYLKQLNKI